MKYPFLSNWIEFRRIPERDVYYVKNYVLDKSCYISSEKMQFARKLDGKTHPAKIRGNRSIPETVNLINELDSLGVIRRDGGRLATGDFSFSKTIVRTRNTKKKKDCARVLNMLLLLSFIPVVIAGIYAFLHINTPSNSAALLESKAVIMIIGVLSVIVAGSVHELCHGIACRAYGGRVFEYGFSVSLLPCFYTLLDDSNVKSRLKRIQIYAAGVEGNLLLFGSFLLLSALLTNIRTILFLAAGTNLAMSIVNILAISGTDGMRIIFLLIGINESYGIKDIKLITRKTHRKKLVKSEGCLGYAKLTICYILLLVQLLLPVIIISDIVMLIRGFI